jgi:predicted dehydrogenase
VTPLNRRDILKAAVFAPAASYARIVGANDRVRLGVVGCGNRGAYIMSMFQKQPDVDVAAVCDVFGEKTDRAAQDAPGAMKFADHRKVVERRDIDAVQVTTPDHWHAAVSIDAMNAGKDIYVEKPLTFRREEGAAIIRAAQVNRRVCQVGMQQRSGEMFLKAKREIIDSGLLGKVSMVRTVWHYSEPFDLGDPREPKPASLDWERWLGQVAWRPWNPHQYHHYRLFLDFGGAAMTDLFTHWIDVVHMLLGQDTPRSVAAMGGIFVARDDRTAPDTANVVAQYDGFTVTFESTSLHGMPEEHAVFHGTNGVLWMTRHRYRFTAKDDGAKPVEFEPPDNMVADHIRNFLDCARSRQEPNCGPYAGDRAAQVCLMATDAYKRNIQHRPPLRASKARWGCPTA